MMKKIAPYGSWPSKISAKILAEKGKRYGHMALDNGTLYWLETRASEKGRGVLLKNINGSGDNEVLPKSVSVRSKVHEYGGGDFCVSDGVVYFSDAKDGCVYQYKDNGLVALTAVDGETEMRFADFVLNPEKTHLIAVREQHGKKQVINELVAISLSDKKISVLHSGFDFYSYPKFSPNGHRICWTCWNQPEMPWDSAELWMADWHGGKIESEHKVSGGENVSIFQPEWDLEGVLHYVSDASGWSNIYSHQSGILNALAPTDHDFAVPQWVFGQATYTINPTGVYALYFEDGQQQLCHINRDNGHIEPITLPFTYFEGALLSDEENLYFCAASPAAEVAMYRYHIATERCEALTESSKFVLTADEVSVAQSIYFESKNGRKCHAFYYPPLNKAFDGPEAGSPPLIVMSHGGPTGATNSSLSPGIQFWTNRGFAVVDVNYAGSTGFGKSYQSLLNGQWGVYDAEDCVAVAEYLVGKKLAAKDGLLIRGGSAGGYTTLCALTFYDTFTAGMSRYGVSDLEALAAECHKFEGRYTDKLVGPLPEAKATYVERSPIHHTEKLSRPILLLQGEDDKVVPPNQAEMMVKALDDKKIPHAYLLFEGEGHGFRMAETIIKAFEAELYFYRQILGIESQEKVEPIEIMHRPSS